MREIYSYELPNEEVREISKKTSDDIPRTLTKTRTSQPQNSRWRDI
jgi:hypothetical protein